MKKQNKSVFFESRQAFTLVELIVVITILAILGTIAFISLQGYSSQARDSKRLSDIQNIKKSLELFSLNTGKYPEPDDYFTVKYGSQDLRYQGTVGEQVSVNLSRNLNEKPIDPSTENEYTYSRTYAGNEYELLSIYESDLVSLNSFFSMVNEVGVKTVSATNSNYPKINGNYNGVYVKAGTYYLPTPSIINSLNTDLDLEVTTDGLLSQIITGGDNNIVNAGFEVSTGGLNGMSVEVFSGILDTDIGEDDYNNKEELAQALIDAYSGTILANVGVYKTIVDTASEDLISLVDTYVLNKDNFVNTTISSLGEEQGGDTITFAMTQEICEVADWIWVLPEDDVYIGNSQSISGFCISPTVDLNNSDESTNDGLNGISWNGYGYNENFRYLGWIPGNLDDTGNSTPININDGQLGQTRELDSLTGYTCRSLGTATKGYTNKTDLDNIEGEDSLENRMRYLAKYKNAHDNIIYTAIDWVDFGIANPINNHAIPALYLADCLDGIKDLTTNMTYIHKDNSTSQITYEMYNTDETIIDTDIVDLDNIIYQNRQKYLTAWTQQSGSHLPSAFSYIDNNTAGGELQDLSTTIWDLYQNNNTKGEYQMACENNYLGTVTSGTNQYILGEDDINNERIWLSAIGSITGNDWGRRARAVGYSGCGDQNSHPTGNRNKYGAARFVVRP